jgi:quercetin dioxygenase-like cupin family protein
VADDLPTLVHHACVKYCRLPLVFDAVAMAREVAALPAAIWTPHFNTDYHDGGWSGVALRSPGGDSAQLYPDPQAIHEYADTAVRAECPTIDAALSAFGDALCSARLLALAPGSCIREHRDYGLNLESGTARLHIAVVSGPNVEFYLDGELMPMEPGECWYLNLDLPHRVQNLGETDRVHLVIDCEATDWLLAQLPGPDQRRQQVEMIERRGAQIDSAQQRLERFRRHALADADLRVVLQAEEDRDSFIGRVVAEGRRRGIGFTAEDVRSAMDASRRAWTERWLVR